MDKVEIKFLKSSPRLSQIYSAGMQYAFFSAAGEQACDFVLCKDFLHDAVHATLNEKKADIYGFEYSPKTHPKLDLENVRFLVANTQDHNMMDKVDNSLDFVHQFEKIFKLKRTRAFQVSNPPNKYSKCGVVGFVGSGRWLQAPPMVSLYTLLLRVGFVHTKGNDAMDTIKKVISGDIKPYQRNDAGYLRQALPAIEKIIKLGYPIFFYKDIKENYKPEVSIGTLHGSGGIVALANGYSKAVNKHWTRKHIQQRLDGTYVPKEKVVEVSAED